MRAGFARRDFTPGVPVATLYDRPETGEVTGRVADPLFVRCAAFEAQDRRAAIVAWDQLAVGAALAEEAKAGLADLGLSPADVLLSCTHSHTTPLTISFRGRHPADEDYCRHLCAATREAVEEALALAHECELGVGVGHFGATINRREMGRLANVNDLAAGTGTVDPELTVLRVCAGERSGCIVNLACHPLTMSAGDAISADFPGAMAAVIEAGVPGAFALFLQGAGGNLNPKIHGGPAERDRFGALVAEEALRIADVIDCRPSDQLATALRTVELPWASEAPLAEAGAIVDRVEAGERVAARDAAWARDLLAADEAGAIPDALAAPAQALRIGPLLIIAIPGEPFVQIGLAIKRAVRERLGHPGRPVMVAGYANATDCGYVPAPEESRFGEYETAVAPRYYPCLLGPGAEARDILADAAADLAAEVGSQ